MSETELVKRLADTLYSDNGLLAKVGNIEGGVRALCWMVGIAVAIFGIAIAYLGYISNSGQHLVYYLSLQRDRSNFSIA